MRTSSYLEQTLFSEQSAATDQYFEDRASHLFEPHGRASFVKVHVQLPLHEEISKDSVWVHPPKCDPKSDVVSDSEPSSPVDCDRFTRKGPPRYVEPARLQRHEIADVSELTEVAQVRIRLRSVRTGTDMGLA